MSDLGKVLAAVLLLPLTLIVVIYIGGEFRGHGVASFCKEVKPGMNMSAARELARKHDVTINTAQLSIGVAYVIGGTASCELSVGKDTIGFARYDQGKGMEGFFEALIVIGMLLVCLCLWIAKASARRRPTE